MARAGLHDDEAMLPGGASTSHSHKRSPDAEPFKLPPAEIDSDSDSHSSEDESNSSPSLEDNQKPEPEGNAWRQPAAELNIDDNSSRSSSSTTDEELDEPKSIYEVWKAPEVQPNPVHESPGAQSVSVSEASSSSEEEIEVLMSPNEKAELQSTGNAWKPPPFGLGGVGDSSSSSSSNAEEEKPSIYAVWKAPNLPSPEAPASPSTSSSSVADTNIPVSPSAVPQHPVLTDNALEPLSGRGTVGNDDRSKSSSATSSVVEEKKKSIYDVWKIPAVAKKEGGLLSPKRSSPKPVKSDAESEDSESEKSSSRREWRAPEKVSPPESASSKSVRSESEGSGSKPKSASSRNWRHPEIETNADTGNSSSVDSSEEQSSGQQSGAKKQAGDTERSKSPSSSTESTFSNVAKEMGAEPEKDKLLPGSGDSTSCELSEGSKKVEEQRSGGEGNVSESEKCMPISSQKVDPSSSEESMGRNDARGLQQQQKLNPLQLLEERRKALAARKEARTATTRTPTKKDFRSLIQKKRSMEEPTTNEKMLEKNEMESSEKTDVNPAVDEVKQDASPPPIPVPGEYETTLWSTAAKDNEIPEHAAPPVNQDVKPFGWSSDSEEQFGWMPPRVPVLTSYGHYMAPPKNSFLLNSDEKPDPPLINIPAGTHNISGGAETAMKQRNSFRLRHSDVGMVDEKVSRMAMDTKSSTNDAIWKKSQAFVTPPVAEISLHPAVDDDSTLGTDGHFYGPVVYQSNDLISSLQVPLTKADAIQSGKDKREVGKYYESWTLPMKDNTRMEQKDPPGTRNKGRKFDTHPGVLESHDSGTRKPTGENPAFDLEGSDDSWVPGRIKIQLKGTVLLDESISKASHLRLLRSGIPPSRTVRGIGQTPNEESEYRKPRSSRSESDSSHSNWNPRLGSMKGLSSEARADGPMKYTDPTRIMQPRTGDISSPLHAYGLSEGVVNAITSMGTDSESTSGPKVVSSSDESSSNESASSKGSIGWPREVSHPTDEQKGSKTLESSASSYSSSSSSSLSSSPSPTGLSKANPNQQSMGNTRDSDDPEQQTPHFVSDENSENSNTLRRVIIAVVIVVFLLIGGILAFVLTRNSDSNPTTAAVSPPTFSPVSRFPTENPVSTPTSSPIGTTPSPMSSPTAAPGDADLIGDPYYELILSKYPEGRISLLNRASPQRNAFEWLRSPLNLQDLPEERILQRYALATFFYSTKGWEWTVASRWLSNEHECSWFTTSTSIEVCNPNKEYAELSLRKNNLKGPIPAEVFVLMKSLGKLDLTTDAVH